MTTLMTPLVRPRLVMVDLDGTLVDSVPDLKHCLDIMWRQLGLTCYPEAQVRNWVGNGVERLVQRALTGDIDGTPEPKLYSKALTLFSELYAVNTSIHSRVYDGVRPCLDWLAAQPGMTLVCITNKAARFTGPLLRNLGLLDYFNFVVAGDTLPQKKPDPAPLLYAAHRCGVAPQHSLMVGDSVSDVKAARGAGFAVVCVSYGYNHGHDIRETNPDVVVDSLAELPPLLASLAAH